MLIKNILKSWSGGYYFITKLKTKIDVIPKICFNLLTNWPPNMYFTLFFYYLPENAIKIFNIFFTLRQDTGLMPLFYLVAQTPFSAKILNYNKSSFYLDWYK